MFEGMLLAHVVGDWLLQTEWQAQNKASHWGAMAAHIVVYHTALLAVLWFGFSLRNGLTLLVVALLAISHVILDRRAFVHGLMRVLRLSVQRSPDPWFCIVIDQCLHFVLLGAAALVLSSGRVF